MHAIMEEMPVNTCYAVRCDKCGKTTWKVSIQSQLVLDALIRGSDSLTLLLSTQGCGAHVESVSF
ncbi:hypothetical protein BJV78DRAFT_1232404 [Lactifluus subvellereus]|nr:hypothetical protein BJV78DRAFT_1232404 [Lactifluus subvellereus]